MNLISLDNNPKTKVLTVDLQSVLLCAMCKASALYYRTKLCAQLHSFSSYIFKTKDANLLYIWNESEGGLTANEFASCLIDFLWEHVKDVDSFIIYSDGCTAQIRKVVLASALSKFAINHNVTTIQKILEKDHTQMEVDSVLPC